MPPPRSHPFCRPFPPSADLDHLIDCSRKPEFEMIRISKRYKEADVALELANANGGAPRGSWS